MTVISRFFTSAVMTAAMLFLSGGVSFAQTKRVSGNYIPEKFTQIDGLADDFVKSVFCDSRGIIWIGTQFGVQWYDGYKLRTVKVPGRNNVNVLGNSIFEDEQHRIVIGTLNGLLVVGQNGIVLDFIDIPLSRSLVRTRDGKLWIPSISRGLRYMAPKDFSAVNLPHHGISVGMDDGGIMYHMTYEGLVERSADQLKTSEKFLDVGPEFNKMHILGHYMFLSREAETCIYDINTRQCIKSGLPRMDGLAEDGDGRIWMATVKGIHVLGDDLELYDIHDASGGSLLSEGAYSCICPDKDGGIWIGYHSGIIHLSRNRWNVKKIIMPVRKNVRLMTPDAHGKIWIAAGSAGLFRYDTMDGSIVKVDLPCRSDNIKAMYADTEHLWMSTTDITDNVICLDIKTAAARKLSSVPGIASNFFKDASGTVWLGSPQCSGYIDDEKFVLTAESHFATMVADNEGRLWTGVKTRGITRHEKNGEDVCYNTELGNFASRGLQQLARGVDGTIWALTEGDGLFFYDKESDSFKTETRLPAGDFGRLMYIAMEKSGSMLITSGNGLIRFSPDGGTWTFLDRKGIFKNSFYGRSICVGNDDELYVGSEGCFYVVDKERYLSEWYDGKILFSSFSVIQSTARKHEDFKLPADIDSLAFLDLPYSCNSFRIMMTDMDFNVLKTGRLVYRLEGYDEQWKPVKGGVVSFLNIPVGDYNLSVRYMGSSGTFVGEGRRLRISVKPPLWVHPGAITLYIAFIIFLIIVIVRRYEKKSDEKMIAAAALREAESEKNLYASKVEFLSNIAHEIKTPLSLVKLPVESLLKRYSGDKALKEDLDTIRRNADVLTSLIEDLMDFQKLEHTEYKLDIVERNICAITMEITDRSRYLFDKKGLEFSISVPKTPYVTAIDTHIYDRILTNLLSNAAKYAESYVKCSLAVKRGTVVFSIENDGIVVPDNMREKIFKAFVRYDEGRHHVEGTGIGLYMSRKFAQMLGGQLNMDSDSTVNRFVLNLPVMTSAPALENTIIPPPSPSPSPALPRRFSHSLLIVEDNDEMTGLLTRSFQDEYDVLTASDGLEALEILQHGNKPSIIISDVMMPHMDGYELCRKVKGDESLFTIPFILLTAKSADDDKLQGFRSGADGYVSKPFSLDVLAELVRTTIEHRKQFGEYIAGHPVSDSSEIALNSPGNRFLQKVHNCIVENLSNEELRMEDIAEYCSVSLSSLQKRMRQICGMSPAEYVTSIKMKEAVRMLADKSIPISEISTKLGFASHSYFSTCFKKEFGVTPSRWREKS